MGDRNNATRRRPAGGQHRVRHNDYGTLPLPAIGEWEPRLSVSVVIPAYGGQEKLDLTLASLAAQSYPSRLLEVVVVDDGSAPPLRLPEIVPERVRLVRGGAAGKWGRAHACHTGATLADGDVIHWLDSDMVVFGEHVEAQLRWHHLADYLVVLGYKRFVDFADDGRVTPQAVFDAVASGSAEKLFDLEESRRHEWIEKIIDETDRLRRHGSRSHRVHVGATASAPSRLLRAAGGMNDSLVLGEDTELGFRPAQQGAVFVPDPEARSWHLGSSTVMRRREEVNRHNEPYLSQRLPLSREWRRCPGRQWLLPFVDVVVDVAFAGTYDDAHPARAEQLRTVLEPARGPGLHVYGRMPTGGDERYRFPAAFHRHVVGSVSYERMLAVYKAYKVFLNVNSTPDSPTRCARRVFELAACGTPVLSGPSRAVEELFAGSVPIARTPKDTRTLLAGLLANPEVRDRQAHLAMREVFGRHTYGHRVDTVLAAIGRPLPRPEPHVSVVMVTNRPAQLPHAFAQVAGQRWGRLQPVLVLHGLDLDPGVVRDKAMTEGIDVVVVLAADGSLPLGQCLNLAIDAAGGDLIAKMDDDDIYGEHYLSDLVPAFSYTDADIVGKRACYVRLDGMNATLLSSPEAEHTYSDLVRGGTLVVRADVLRRLRFDHVPRGSDTKLLRRAGEAGIRIYSADRFNYLYVRSADPSAHTWQITDAALLKSAKVVFYGPPEQHVCV